MTFNCRNFRVCKECTPPHVENCEICFGWGFHNGSPITAGQIESVVEFEICSECLGDPYNEDIIALWGDSDSEKPVGVINAAR